MNLHAYANGPIAAVNPNLIGTLKQSTGYGYPGDASFTGSITANTLTVSAIATGALAVGSLVQGSEIASATTVSALGTGSGGIGAYTLSGAPQIVASEPMTATGSGARAPTYSIAPNVPMQFQAMTSDELQQIDGLNISATYRAVHMNGDLQGLDRPGVKGGDILLAPTGLTGVSMDTWLVVKVLEAFDASGWCRLAVVLQQAAQSQ